MASKSPPPLSESQLEIMSVVWELGDCTVADVLEVVRKNRAVTRNTIHTMMSRLVDKGWLQVVDAKSAFVYRAEVDRSTVQNDCIDRLVDLVFDGSAEGLLLSLLQNRSLSKGEAARIRRMIRDAEDRQ